MTIQMAIELAQKSLNMILILSAPMLLIGLLVGLVVSIFQATTQIQEATLSFVPKIVAVFIAFIAFGPWMMQLAVEFTRDLFLNMDKFVR